MSDYSDSAFPRIRVETFDFGRGVPQSVEGTFLVDIRGTDVTACEVERITGQVLLGLKVTGNLAQRILVGDDGACPRAVAVGDTLVAILAAQGIRAEVEHHHPVPGRERPAATGDVTREAARAFYRLHQATAAVAANPFRSGALEALSNAAYEANTALAAAGMLSLSQDELVMAVRQEFPGYDPTGGAV
ncbi:hypothetical protein [Streptomyces sp. NBC_01462]|uniref:hypothetical protein n=1 Tax=Streptomyces sp. NBC_01462 TaxID=2903876 RepID=UPI002E364F6D|nr:hypothetical protein [Streptomyces sp. NBC_01462]